MAAHERGDHRVWLCHRTVFALWKISGSSNRVNAANPRTGIVGAGLIWLGTILIPVSLWRFLLEERHIDRPIETRTRAWPMIAVALLLAAVGVYLAVADMP